MAITADKVIAPIGEIDRLIMFPDEGTEAFGTRIVAYVDDANQRAPDNDEAALAWVYYRAFSAVATRMLTQPASAELAEGGSYNYMMTQLSHVQNRAEYWRQQFMAAANEPVSVPHPTTQAVKNQFTP